MKTSALFLLASAALAGAAPEGQTLKLPELEPCVSVRTRNYELHEWGTFTTVAGSDGVLLSGLEREEEVLPGYVHSHFGLENGQVSGAANLARMMERHGTLGFSPFGMKGLGKRPLAGVTVKMETPVLYFHSAEAFHAKVKIGFEGGTISQWYPERSGGETLPEPPPSRDPKNKPTPLNDWLLDFSKGYRGSIEWNVDVLSPEDSRKTVLFKPGDTLGWLRARVPDTNVLKTDKGETEGYLFYRGVGNFDPGLKTTVDSTETIHLTNKTGFKIPYLVAFERLPGGGLRWTERRQGLEAAATFELPESAFTTAPNGFCEPLYRAVASGLAGCGLTEAESRAMVETWWNSYFEAPGLRVFWVLPEGTTQRILPLEVSPAPLKTVRVLVGRSEIFRPRYEREWQKMAALLNTEDRTWINLINSHRFATPIQQRVEALKVRVSRE